MTLGGPLLVLLLISFAACSDVPAGERFEEETSRAPESEPVLHEENESSETLEPAFSLPTDHRWASAENFGSDMIRPRRIGGEDLDPWSYTQGRKHYLSVCILAVVIDEDGSVEWVDFLAPRDASAETRNHFIQRVGTWRYSPATRHGKTLRVRQILSVSDCPYLPSDPQVQIQVQEPVDDGFPEG